MRTYPVAEWFTSINGEGTHAGELAVLFGCVAAICSAAIVIRDGRINRMEQQLL